MRTGEFMTDSASQHEPVRHTQGPVFGAASTLSDTFLARLVAELDDETVTAIILHGSYARGDAMPPYSDVDLVRVLKDFPGHKEQKRYIYRDGYLLSISTRPLSLYRERFTLPQWAIFIVSGIREARILLDKEGAFRKLQQEALAFRWEPLQAAADTYASQMLMEETEIVHKTLRALLLHDAIALADMLQDLFTAATEAVAVQRGVLISSGNTYFHEVQQAVGQDSLWTRYHLRAAGIASNPPPSIENRSIAALRLYQETVRLLHPAFDLEQREVVEQAVQVIEQALSQAERA
jgi:predicted nucleotidyltransferase